MSRKDNLTRCTRRSVLATVAGLPVAAALAQQGHSQAARGEGAAQPKVKPKPLTLADLQGYPPLAQIGKAKISRIIFGGNQIADYNHCTRYPYINQIISAYYTPEKIASALSMAEKCGVNTILTNPRFIPKLQAYWKNFGGKIQFISDCGGADTLAMAQQSIDVGAVACYIHGATSDRLVSEGNFDLMSKVLELIRKNGLPAGIGAHQLETVKGAVSKGLHPDFWMKAFHPITWGGSNKLVQGYDEISCRNAAGEWNGTEVLAFMKDLKEPWIAFKTMAVGVVPPADAFKYAFDNGADFVCVGMFEWQLVTDINAGLAAIKGATNRDRPWRALAPGA